MDAYDEVSNARREPDTPDAAATENDPTTENSPAEGPVAADPPALETSRAFETSPAPETSPVLETSPASETSPVAPAPPAGIAALSLSHQIGIALVLAVVAVVTCVHIGMVFLHVAPANTVTKQHGQAVDRWVYPEFEQNWKLFAPNPLQANVAVQVRAEVRTRGVTRTTGWYDLSALDGAAIDGNLLPSHTQQNELRRAWDFYVSTHDNENRATSSRGDLSRHYLRRIVVLRLDREQAGGEGAVVERVQVRSRTTNVPPPDWSEEQVSDKPVVRELPWWTVPGDDRTETRAAGTTTKVNGRAEAGVE